VASAAISRGRVYFVSSDTLYAIGKKTRVAAQTAVDDAAPPAPGSPGQNTFPALPAGAGRAGRKSGGGMAARESVAVLI